MRLPRLLLRRRPQARRRVKVVAPAVPAVPADAADGAADGVRWSRNRSRSSKSASSFGGLRSVAPKKTRGAPELIGPFRYYSVVVSDEALMLAFQNGSREAFEELFARYRAPIFGFFVRRISVRNRAEDLVQETFTAVVHGARRYKPTALVRTWLYSIALKQISNERRRRSGSGRHSARSIPTSARFSCSASTNNSVTRRSRSC